MPFIGIRSGIPGPLLGGSASLPAPPAGFIYLQGTDGSYLLGSDGAYLLGVAP